MQTNQHEINRLSEADLYDEKLTERAIADLTDMMERGEDYPPRAVGGWLNQINRLDILLQQEVDVLAGLIDRELADGPCAIDMAVTKLLKAYFESDKGKGWVSMRAEELREEDREDSVQATWANYGDMP